MTVYMMYVCISPCQSIEELEVELLNGQKLQGPQTSADVYKILVEKDMVSK